MSSMSRKPTRNGKDPGKGGPPTKEQRRYNRLKDNVLASLDKQLDAFEKLNAEYPQLILSILALAKNQPSITLPNGTTQAVGEYQTLKFLIGYHQDLYNKLAETLEWTDKAPAGSTTESGPTGVVALFSTKAVS